MERDLHLELEQTSRENPFKTFAKKAVFNRFSAGLATAVGLSGGAYFGLINPVEINAETPVVARGVLTNIETQPAELHALPDKVCVIAKTCPTDKSFTVIPEVNYAVVDVLVDDGQSQTYREVRFSITHEAAEKFSSHVNEEIELTEDHTTPIAQNQFHERH